jgi:hypothetical protein
MKLKKTVSKEYYSALMRKLYLSRQFRRLQKGYLSTFSLFLITTPCTVSIYTKLISLTMCPMSKTCMFLTDVSLLTSCITLFCTMLKVMIDHANIIVKTIRFILIFP